MSRSRTLAALVAAALAAAVLPSPASVQAGPGDRESGGPTPRASDEERATARRHFLRGKELHAAGKYLEAAAEYREAYEHLHAPAFLYNVAQVYRLAGDRKSAIEYYRKYLELEPEGEGSADAREFIAALEAAPGRDADGGTAAETLPPSSAGARAEPIDPIRRETQRDDLDLGAPPGRGKKIIGTAIGAAGVVALGVAVGFGFRARSAADEIDNYEGRWTPVQEQTYEDGQAAERTMVISAAIGAAAVVAGAVVFYLGHRDARRARARTAAIELRAGAPGTGDGAFLVLRGAF